MERFLRELDALVKESGLPIYVIRREGIFPGVIDLTGEGKGVYNGVQHLGSAVNLEQILSRRVSLNEEVVARWREELLSYPAILPLPEHIANQIDLARHIELGKEAFLFWKALDMSKENVRQLPSITVEGTKYSVVGSVNEPGRKGKRYIVIEEVDPSQMSFIATPEYGGFRDKGRIIRVLDELEDGEFRVVSASWIFDDEFVMEFYKDESKRISVEYLSEGRIPLSELKKFKGESYKEYIKYLIKKIPLLKNAVEEKYIDERSLLKFGLFLLGFAEEVEDRLSSEDIRKAVMDNIPQVFLKYEELKRRMDSNGRFRVKLEEII